jgi:hypothetical protein
MEFNVDAAPQFACNLVLPRRRGARLKTYQGCRAIERLDAENPRTIDESL